MAKSLLTGMAAVVALAAFAGNADAYVKRAPVYAKKIAPTRSLPLSSLPLSSLSMSALRAKGGPLHDCVHVLFPQCSRGYGEPND
jgi:hypothetical protein